MPTITLTPTAVADNRGTISQSWQTMYYYMTTNSSYYPRTLNFQFEPCPQLGGQGVNITMVTIHGYVRNSNSSIKTLAFGFRPALNSTPTEWAQVDGADVIGATFTAITGGSGVPNDYIYQRVARNFDGNTKHAAHIKQCANAGTGFVLGVIAPSDGRSINVNPTLANWQIDVTYEIIGNIPTTSVSTATIGATSITTTINRIIDGSTTRLRYRIGSTVLSTVNLGTGLTHSYTPPTSCGSAFPNTVTGVLTVSADTYDSGGNILGTVEAAVTLNLPSDAAPTATRSTTRLWLSTVPSASRISAYVQSKSGIRFTCTGTPMYGATIAEHKITIEGVTYTGDVITHPVFQGSGEVRYTHVVTDSRGLSRTYTGSYITVRAWSMPSIHSFTITRVTNANVSAIDGTYARGDMSATVSSLVVSGAQKNVLKLTVYYRQITEDNSAAWVACDTVTGTDVTGVFSGLLMKNGAYLGGGGVDAGGNTLPFNDMAGYEFRLVVQDLYASVQAMYTIPTKETMWDIDQSTGKMGFGGDAPEANEDVGFRFYMPIEAMAGIRGIGEFSTSEHLTGGTWFDGRPIYRTAYEPRSVNKSATVNFGTIANLDYPINAWGFAYTGANWEALNYSPNNLNYVLELQVSSAGIVRVIAGSGRNWTRVFCVVEYVKTTD